MYYIGRVCLLPPPDIESAAKDIFLKKKSKTNFQDTMVKERTSGECPYCRVSLATDRDELGIKMRGICQSLLYFFVWSERE